MMKRVMYPLIVFLLLSGCSSQKHTGKIDALTIQNLKAHIGFLADDQLEGRRTGSAGEQRAVEYISNQFKSIGLIPKGTNGFVQPFEVHDGKFMKPSSLFMIGDTGLVEDRDYFAFPFSPNMPIDAFVSPMLQEMEMPWIIDLKDGLEEQKSNPHFDLNDYIRTNAKKAKERGATAVILYNSSSIEDNLKFNGKDRSESLAIPVLYVKKEVARKYFFTESSFNLKINVDLAEKKRTGHNVVGFLDNGAASTVILGAHFDHLGYGEDGNSMLRTGERLIHNGADDNASGTATLIELARRLSASGAKNYNFLFIAFSGEELGLLGSKHFTEFPTIDLKKMNFMINMDMVGRLNDSSMVLTVGGYGTSPAWGAFYQDPSWQDKKQKLTFRFDSSGTGPSDHTSFYRKDIPVLFFFTGLHTDYHKPTDDADKINIAGMNLIVGHIENLIRNMNGRPPLLFTKTKEAASSTSARFTVSMGIMPDYSFTGGGVKVDAVSEGKPAAKAGISAGDIIVKLGAYATSSMEAYMQALSKFRKGDKATVIYKRGGKELETTVAF